MMDDLNELPQLLEKYAKLPARQENLLEIAGYPHYENVCSNILIFFLNPENEHGLSDLFYSSLMSIIDQPPSATKYFEIEREVITEKGGRLDIVIKTDNQIVGIENKIYHHLNNDLADYSASIKRWASDSKLEEVKIILSIRKELESDGFKSITYKEYWAEIRNKIGENTLDASNKWHNYLHDFMSAIENTYGGDMELNEIDEFFVHNDELIEKMLQDRRKFQSRLFQKVRSVRDLIDTPDECKRQWIFSKNMLVHDFVLTGNLIAVELEITAKGWVLQMLGRNAESKAYLLKLFARSKKIRSGFGQYNSKIFVNKYELREDHSAIGQDVNVLCADLVAADKALQTNLVSSIGLSPQT